MSISTRLSSDSSEVVIDIEGRFDFSQQKTFRDAYRDTDRGMRYRINLAKAEYLDSAALGMLLLLRQHAGEDSNRVVLAGAPPSIRKILDIANFNKLFVIE